MTNAERQQVIHERLSAAFTPSQLQITDDSHLHIGHAGAQSGAGHFSVMIQSDQFQGKSPVQCHRLIYQQLDDLIPQEIHALAIKIL